MRRLFTYSYIIAKRAKEMQKELLKKENNFINFNTKKYIYNNKSYYE